MYAFFSEMVLWRGSLIMVVCCIWHLSRFSMIRFNMINHPAGLWRLLMTTICGVGRNFLERIHRIVLKHKYRVEALVSGFHYTYITIYCFFYGFVSCNWLVDIMIIRCSDLESNDAGKSLSLSWIGWVQRCWWWNVQGIFVFMWYSWIRFLVLQRNTGIKRDLSLDYGTNRYGFFRFAVNDYGSGKTIRIGPKLRFPPRKPKFTVGENCNRKPEDATKLNIMWYCGAMLLDVHIGVQYYCTWEGSILSSFRINTLEIFWCIKRAKLDRLYRRWCGE